MNTKKLTYEQKRRLQNHVINMGLVHYKTSLFEDIMEATESQSNVLFNRYVNFPKMPLEDFSAIINMDELEPSDIADIDLPDDVNVCKFQVYLYDTDEEIFDSFGTIEVFRDYNNLPENSFYRSLWI